MVRTKQTREILAETYSEYVLMGLGRLALGWDPAKAKYMVKVNNIKYEELRPFVKDVRICRQKVVNTAEGNVR